MRQTMLRTAGAIVFFIFLMASSACSQTLNIWPGVAPGSENWTWKEKVVDNTPLGTVIFNVVTPTLTVYLPEKTKATGTGVIIAPGGAFVALAVDLEGNNVARWLQSKGIAAFVLKYRIMEKRQEGIPADLKQTGSSHFQRWRPWLRHAKAGYQQRSLDRRILLLVGSAGIHQARNKIKSSGSVSK